MEKIIKIGKALNRCSFNCEGIINNPKKGIIPRCLYYEERDKNGKGAIVIGLNPGESSPSERNYYLDNNSSYQAGIDYWEKKIQNFAYYKKARELITTLGFTGDIVWSDLAKCESAGNRGEVPVQTLRICIDRFLEKEIKSLPKNFTIITLGNEPFKFCALRFPKRFVLGLPHPTGAYGTYSQLRRNVNKNRRKYINLIKRRKDENNYYKAIKIFK